MWACHQYFKTVSWFLHMNRDPPDKPVPRSAFDKEFQGEAGDITSVLGPWKI